MKYKIYVNIYDLAKYMLAHFEGILLKLIEKVGMYYTWPNFISLGFTKCLAYTIFIRRSRVIRTD